MLKDVDSIELDDIDFIEYKKVDLSNSMLILAFPTVGLVSSIAGRFIVDYLHLEEIGAIRSRYLIPVTVIHNARPSYPVRIYAGKKVCGFEGCDQLVVIISEFMPSREIIDPLANKILDWAQKKRCKIIVTLEGTHASGEKKQKLQVYSIGTTPAMKEILKKFKFEEIQEGIITGVTGVLLPEGVRLQRNILCLLSETEELYPDSRAAGNLLKSLNKLIPEILIDPKPLYEAADIIEKNIRKSIGQAKPTAPQMQPGMPNIYA
jgi:uncharacterized protein